MTPLDFLKLLWQFKPEELYVLLWTLPDKQSHWHRDIATAAEFVSNARDLDVYVGVGLSRVDYGPSLRFSARHFASITVFSANSCCRQDARSKKAILTTLSDSCTFNPPS